MIRNRSFAVLVKRAAGILCLTVIYGSIIIFSDFLAWIRRIMGVARAQPGTLVLTGTFHNPNWSIAHITPLVGAGFRRIMVIADGHIGAVSGIEVIVPPAWLMKTATRAGAKLLVLIMTCWRIRPALVMGYHIFPAATSALLASRICGSQSGFQVTSGPLELEGGGWHAENRLLVSLGWSSRTVELLAQALTRRFDLVVVRGTAAQTYVKEKCGYIGNVAIVTGSVVTVPESDNFDDRNIDVLFVGRLTEYKRPDRFVEVMRHIVERTAAVRAVVVGEGVDREEIEQLIAAYGLKKNIELLGLRDDVPALMARSRVLLQTSRWEGVSIAVLEAMMHGMVPVVSDVGDMRDVVRPDETGYVIPPDDISGYARSVIRLLSDPKHWTELSAINRQSALKLFSTDAIRETWHRIFAEMEVIDSPLANSNRIQAEEFPHGKSDSEANS